MSQLFDFSFDLLNILFEPYSELDKKHDKIEEHEDEEDVSLPRLISEERISPPISSDQSDQILADPKQLDHKHREDEALGKLILGFKQNFKK